MISLLLLTYGDTGSQMIEAASKVLGYSPEQVAVVAAIYNEAPEALAPRLESTISSLSANDGVLILTDLYGTTHSNVASRFIDSSHVEMVAGLNMAMLIRALSYRNETMTDLINKVSDGGRDGIRLCSKLDNYKKLVP